MDIVQNSISAGAELIEVGVAEDIAADTLTITIDDDGCGMSEETVSLGVKLKQSTSST